MRIVTLLCSAIMVLAPAVGGAQTPPPDSVSEVLRQKIRPGTVQDYEGARKWMQLASEAGNGQAQLALGLMYRTGLGIPVDNVKAYVWLNVAAAQGVPGATGARDVVLPRLSPAELQEAQAEARRLGAIYVPKAPSQ